MTKLMDELVEIGAKAIAAKPGYRDDHRPWVHDVQTALSAVLPVLAQRMDAADPGSPDSQVFRRMGIASTSKGQARIYMREMFKQELGIDVGDMLMTELAKISQELDLP